MPSLSWICKSAIVEHHKAVPLRLLGCGNDFSVGDQQTPHLLVQSANLKALKALLAYYDGHVKRIYRDPPYYTGNEGWVYDYAGNQPPIKQ